MTDIATAEMIASVGNNLSRLITDLFIRVEQLDQRISNTLENSPMILENLNNRIQKLEDKFDQLNGATDERIVEVIVNSSVIDDKVEAALDDKLEGAIDECIDNIDWEDKVDSSVIRRVIRNDLTFTVEVD